jgi:hypothetical protein
MRSPAQQAHAASLREHRIDTRKGKAGQPGYIGAEDHEPSIWGPLATPCGHCGGTRGLKLNGVWRCRACGYPA